MFNFLKPRLEQKASRGFRIHFQNLLPAVWSSRDYRKFSVEGYQYNVIVNSAINRLSRAVSSITYQARLADGSVTRDHPVLDLLKRPNPRMSGYEWWHTRISYLLLSGNIFDEAVEAQGRIIELWPLRPDRVEILPSRTGLPRGYRYRVGQQTVEFPSDPITGQSLINHTRLFHPLDDLYGMSAVEAAAYGIDQHNEGVNWVQSLLQNAARPSGALVAGSDNPLSDDEYKRLKADIEEQYSGSNNAGRPMLLEGGLDWKPMGLSPLDMEILKAREMAARDISLAFGVPPLLLNIPGDNTYANYREARLGFYEDTVIPLVNSQMASINHFLEPSLGGARIEPAMESIEAIAEKRMKQWEMADNSDDITLNESRQLKGLPPLPAPLGDTLMAEIRKGAQEPKPEDDPAEALKRLSYGRG